MVYEWINYDVWGNAEDGFEVNDKHRSGVELAIPDEATDVQILAALREAGVFNNKATTKTVDIDGEGDGVFYFEDAKNGKPLGELMAKE
jgi:hypothetical protein